MRVAAVAAGAFEQRRQRGAIVGRIVETDDARPGSAWVSGPTTGAKACSTTSAFTEASHRM